MGRYSKIDAFGRPSDKDMEAVMKAAEETGAIRYIDRPYNELSGGEIQLAIIASALAQETEILILQNNPGNNNSLCFSNYVCIDVNKGIREGYIDSFQRFMESLIRTSKSKVISKEAIKDIRKSRISIRDSIVESIDECKKIPKAGKKIIKDRFFYHCTGYTPD